MISVRQKSIRTKSKDKLSKSEYKSNNHIPNTIPAQLDMEGHTHKTPTEKKTVLESHGYNIGKIIGMGSYATVKLAESSRHNCQVAIKIVSKIQAPTDYLKKFLPREIEVVKGLKHTNLIRFLQAIETTHRVYIIMEYAENGSLLDIIRRDGIIKETQAKLWFQQLINAIEYCHDRGVVHRDIKCENLLIDTRNNIKVSDFGFARTHIMKNKASINNTKDSNQILSETFCGSYAYASPEILKGIPYNPQFSDIWSTGVVLFAMVFGRLPFDDTNYSDLLKQVQNDVVFPKEPKISTECKSLISKILSPVRIRLSIKYIKEEDWFQEEIHRKESFDLDHHRSDELDSISTTEPSDDEKSVQ